MPALQFVALLAFLLFLHFVVGLFGWSLVSKFGWNKRVRGPILLVMVTGLCLIHLGPGKFLLSVRLGGSATTGKIEGGRYFVGYRGEYTEVSRNAYNFSRAYGYGTDVTSALCVVAWLAYSPCVIRRSRRESKARIAELRARNDIQALCELIDMLEFQETDATFGYLSSVHEYVCPHVDLAGLRVAIEEKTSPVLEKEGMPLALSPRRTLGERSAEKEAWLQWVTSHEEQLCEYLTRSPPGETRNAIPMLTDGATFSEPGGRKKSFVRFFHHSPPCGTRAEADLSFVCERRMKCGAGTAGSGGLATQLPESLSRS